MDAGWGSWNGGWGSWDQYGYGMSREAQYAAAYGGYAGGYPAGPMAPSYRPPPPGYDQHPLGFGPTPLPMRPRAPPPPMFGRRTNRQDQQRMRTENRPFEERAMRYLMKCGLSKDFVKKIPKEILPLMEPTHCGLCSFEFNSFALSRIHYNSKGHLSAQKKWIQQRDNMGPANLKELPLKSRDLYCELCDVQITSKVHGDSHYAGKPHRAIVEGRKVPKNPMLLQPGMERRLDQLIRREKRAYSKKGDNESGEEGEETSAEKVEPKPIVPELYCEICKTAVTCSEQMTMHMNGKRHLSKEKQHILKMMKGGSADGDEDEDEDEYDEDEEDANGHQSGANYKETPANGVKSGANLADAALDFNVDNPGWQAPTDASTLPSEWH